MKAQKLYTNLFTQVMAVSHIQLDLFGNVEDVLKLLQAYGLNKLQNITKQFQLNATNCY